MTPVTTWDQLLDDYEAYIASLEERLAHDLWDADTPAFCPPEDIAQPATEAQQRRFEGLAERAQRCEERLAAALQATQGELAAGDRRRGAAREYLVH